MTSSFVSWYNFFNFISDFLAVSDGSSCSACGFPLARLAVPGVPCEPGAADGGGDCFGQGGGDRVDRVSLGGKLVVVIEAVFFTILFSGLVSLNGTGFSPCSEPDAAATLCDAMVVLFAHGYFPTLCCAVWTQQ